MANALRIALLRIDGFRNLSNIDFEPDPQANVFLGANGQGKTALLEAMDYVATLRSFRGATRAQLVGHDVQRAELAMRIEGLQIPREFRVRIDRTSRDVTLDGKRPERAVTYYGDAACVVFHPQDLDLIRGAPATRRRLLDRILVRVVDGYGEALRSYARALRSRNALLRERTTDPRAIGAYDSILTQYGSVIVRERIALTAQLVSATKEAVDQVALLGGDVTMTYRTRASESIEEYQATLKQSLSMDTVRKLTLVGPHADDLSILWSRRAARVVASQGQTRALALALRLAELRVLTERTGRIPWLLLDDVSSELDRERTERLFALIDRLGAQLWVTTTDHSVASLLSSAAVRVVRGGQISV